jgi:hypothetical protein
MNEFVVITDPHYILDSEHASIPDAVWKTGFSFCQNEFRRYSTAEARITAAFDLAESKGLNLIVCPGDLIEGFAVGGGDSEARLQGIVNIIDAHSYIIGGGAWYNALGNHETAAFSLDLTVYGGVINNSSYTNAYTSGSVDRAFSFDKDGIHYIVLDTNNAGSLGEGNDDTNWLIADLAASKLPKILFSHKHLSEIYFSCGSDYVNITNASGIRSILEADGNVQAVFSGHYHTASYSPQIINDIWYVGLRGSVLSTSTDDTTNAYYHVKVRPNATQGDSQQRANIEIDGYVNGESKPFRKYLL